MIEIASDAREIPKMICEVFFAWYENAAKHMTQVVYIMDNSSMSCIGSVFSAILGVSSSQLSGQVHEFRISLDRSLTDTSRSHGKVQSLDQQ